MLRPRFASPAGLVWPILAASSVSLSACAKIERGFHSGTGGSADTGGSANTGGLENTGESADTGGSENSGGAPVGGSGGVASAGTAAGPAVMGGAAGDVAAGGAGGGAGSSGAAGSSDGLGEAGAGGAAPCAEHDCLNGAACEPAADTFTCICPAGFEGAKCEIDVDDCDPIPCENGGICTDATNGFVCACHQGFTGPDCSLPRFEPLPTHFTMRAISGDGSTLVGSHVPLMGPGFQLAAKYRGGKLQNLGAYVGDTESGATAASGDGRIVVGYSGNSLTGSLTNTRAVRWTDLTVAELPTPEGYKDCRASDASSDGSVVVGTCQYRDLVLDVDASAVVRWSEGTAEVIAAPEQTPCHNAYVSDDGANVLGTCSKSGFFQLFRWTPAAFTWLTVPSPLCQMNALSADGRVAVGSCGGGSVAYAFQWTEQDGVSYLQQTPNFTVANDVSGDGEFIVGAVYNDLVRWNAQRTAVPLRDLFVAVAAGSSGWQLYAVNLISRDGRTMAGTATDPDDLFRGWIVRVD